jgi:hypothetical protein
MIDGATQDDDGIGLNPVGDQVVALHAPSNAMVLEPFSIGLDGAIAEPVPHAARVPIPSGLRIARRVVIISRS